MIEKDSKFLKIYKNKKILITGSTGFKGAWLSFWLKNLGAKVIGVGLKPEKGSVLFKVLKLKHLIKQHFIDLTDFYKINKLIKKEKPDMIFHMAAQSIVSNSYLEPLNTIKTNTLGSANILECVRKNKIKNLIYVTSDKCYLNVEKKQSYNEKDILGGFDNYSSSKAAAEIIFQSYFYSYFKKDYLSHATVRAGNVIGGGDMKKNRVIPDIIKSLNLNKKIKLRNPNSTRPWQHVLEPLYGYLKLGSMILSKKLKKVDYPHWNFGPHKKNCIKVIEISKMIIERWSSKKFRINIQKNEKFKETKLLSLTINKAKKELKWKPKLTLKENINMTVDWYKSYYQKKNMQKFTLSQIKFFLEKK